MPAEVVRRRYHRGVGNFLHVYRPLASTWRTWRVYDNSASSPRLLAVGSGDEVLAVEDDDGWAAFERSAQDA